ncbi:MAG: four-carbon acid sugar kinase family protein [Rhodospirillales bacterium]|nr:four-carbon acid sugar kinase family protein [Rhodospirillales bacterium]
MTALRPLPSGPLVAWYGDDFTGSAAVMEVLSFSGLPAVLFFDLPTDDQLAPFSNYRGIGIAGYSRSQTPQWMDQTLPTIYDFLKQTMAPIRHYKVCSTLDSSPEIGSIGRAADLALADGEAAALVMAAPEIGRYQAFGNLFARAGDDIFRLDRHPTMSAHPVTPMNEGDVRLHLSSQTELQIGLIDLLDLKAGIGSQKFAKEVELGKSIIAFDVVDAQTLEAAGRVIWQNSEKSQFAIGSQGLEYALVSAWRHAGLIAAPPPLQPVTPAAQIAVVSGSCSPVTEQQINQASRSGFTALPIDVSLSPFEKQWGQECERVIKVASEVLAQGLSPIVYTARGPRDPSIPALRDAIARSGRQPGQVNKDIGIGLGNILDQLISKAGLSRVGIAGGDTSSFAAQQLGLYAVTAKYLLSPGASVLVGHADNPSRDGLEISLKGGQMGEAGYFADLRDGRIQSV